MVNWWIITSSFDFDFGLCGRQKRQSLDWDSWDQATAVFTSRILWLRFLFSEKEMETHGPSLDAVVYGQRFNFINSEKKEADFFLSFFPDIMYTAVRPHPKVLSHMKGHPTEPQASNTKTSHMFVCQKPHEPQFDLQHLSRNFIMGVEEEKRDEKSIDCHLEQRGSKVSISIFQTCWNKRTALDFSLSYYVSLCVWNLPRSNLFSNNCKIHCSCCGLSKSYKRFGNPSAGFTHCSLMYRLLQGSRGIYRPTLVEFTFVFSFFPHLSLSLLLPLSLLMYTSGHV